MSPRLRGAERGKRPRGAKARRRPTRRVPRAALLALVLAYACLLGISPVGQAGLLWLHLATEHHGVAVRPTAEHAHDAGRAHRHDSARHDGSGGGHGHTAPPGDDAGRPASPGAPHEHDGRVHTHDPAPVGDPAVPAGALSEHYLPPDVASPPPSARDAAVPPTAAPAPRRAAPPVDTPPPRRPG